MIYIMKRSIIILGSVLFISLLLIGTSYVRGKANPKPKMVFPESGSTQSGIIILLTKQENARIPYEDIKSIRFEYSDSNRNWNLIRKQTSPFLRQHSRYSNLWETSWDTSRIPSGMYAVRAVMETKSGKVSFSPTLDIRIDKEPVAMASARLIRQEELDLRRVAGATVMFDGSDSKDPDGTVIKWVWDFGDGMKGDGKKVTHTYSNKTRSYDIVLTVYDNLGIRHAAYYVIKQFSEVLFQMAPTTECICKSIALRGDNLPNEQHAIGSGGAVEVGPNGAVEVGPGGTIEGGGWDAIPGADGKTLGPLDGNLGDPANAAGEKEWTGYAFEIAAEIEGDPAHCAEMQLVKSTLTAPAIVEHNLWTGNTADLDKDGTDDIDVSTAAKCTAKGGIWDPGAGKCTLEFPQAGTSYGPDTPNDTDPEGAYEHPYQFKEYLGNKIIWYDAPGFSDAPNNTTQKADFISYILGTDKKYCYVKFSLDTQKRAGKDKETLTQNASATGASSIPGVP